MTPNAASATSHAIQTARIELLYTGDLQDVDE